MTKKSANFPFSPAKFPFFYGWIIVALGTMGVIMSIPGQTIGVSAFKEHLVEALGIKSDDLSLAYLIGTLTSGFMLTHAGRAYDKFGVRTVAALASAGLGIVLISLSNAPKFCLWLGELSFWGPKMATLTFMAVAFFFLRFFGQGILTMVSRNMMMKWFKHRRGLVNGISGVFVTLGFATAPKFFNYCNSLISWQNTWLYTGIFATTVFVVVILIFFRDNPEQCGLVEDGRILQSSQHEDTKNQRCYTLSEALKTYSFWPFVFAFCMSALYVTAVTFHIEDIFKQAGLTKEMAFKVFIPSGIIGVCVNFFCGWLSDKVKLKYINLILLSGLFLSMVGVTFLSGGLPYYCIILGHGLAGGTFTLLVTVTWPRFFGRTNLGAISGFSMSALVIASALGPWLLSKAKTLTGSYNISVVALAVITVVIMCASLKADKPTDGGAV